MISSIVRRDLILAFMSGGAWLHGLFFFGVFIALAAVALGGSLNVMRPLAPAIIWLALIFSAQLSFPSIFQEDFQDGNLAQLKLAGLSLFPVVAAKAISFALLSIVPLLVAIPFASLVFDLRFDTTMGILASILFAAPALVIYGVLSSAILSGRRGGGFLIVLMTAPFLIPLLIFGLAAVTAFPLKGITALEFRALIGLSLIAVAVGIPAAAGALNANLE
jgi:heme exporter protein B